MLIVWTCRSRLFKKVFVFVLAILSILVVAYGLLVADHLGTTLAIVEVVGDAYHAGRAHIVS